MQGDIEKVASRSPEQLTALFEQIAGSDVLTKPYEEAAAAKARAEEAAALLFAKKKSTAAERKQKKEQKDEAERHLAALDAQVCLPCVQLTVCCSLWFACLPARTCMPHRWRLASQGAAPVPPRC